jgi:putative transcriptional regulator
VYRLAGGENYMTFDTYYPDDYPDEIDIIRRSQRLADGQSDFMPSRSPKQLAWRGRKCGNILYMLRATKGITQAELARKAGVSRRTINAIENIRNMPSVYTALAIAQVLEMPVEAIFKLHNK